MKIFLSQSTFLTIKKEVSKSKWKETGGILIGYKTVDQIVVTEATGPGPNALHSMFNFQRDVEYCNHVLEQRYTESEGVYGYVGEWHTHPFGKAIPSEQDKEEMIKISETSSYQNNMPILLIVRHSKKKLKVGPYVFQNRKSIKAELFSCD